MMNALQLQLLDAALRREPVLSIYLSLDKTSSPDRWSWSLELEHAVKRIRDTLAAASHDEREKFDATVRHAERALRSLSTGSERATWIAFATPAGVRHSETVSVALPTTIAWGEGIRLTPYLRVLTEEVPVVVIVADSAHLDLWECRDDHCRLAERIHAHQPANHEAAPMSGAPPRAGFHTGTRGGIGRDEWQRQRRDGTTKMLELGAARAKQLAGATGWLCVGGIAHVARRLLRMIGLPARAQGVKLDVHGTVADITAVARESARAMRERRDAVEVRDTVDHAVPSGFAVLGPVETISALELDRVKDLFISERFLRERPGDAESGVRHARRQAARVVIVGGNGEAMLDAQGGLAARLRYRLDGSAAPVRTA